MKQYAMFYDGRFQFFLHAASGSAAEDLYGVYLEHSPHARLSYDLIDAREVTDRSPISLAHACAAVAWEM